MNYSIELFGYGYAETMFDEIKQSLFAIIFTSKGEKIYMPEYGAGALDYIDKPHYEAQKLMVSISEQVTMYESRVKLTTINVITGSDLAHGKIAVKMTFKIIPMNIYSTLVFNDDGTISQA